MAVNNGDIGEREWIEKQQVGIMSGFLFEIFVTEIDGKGKILKKTPKI